MFIAKRPRFYFSCFCSMSSVNFIWRPWAEIQLLWRRIFIMREVDGREQNMTTYESKRTQSPNPPTIPMSLPSNWVPVNQEPTRMAKRIPDSIHNHSLGRVFHLPQIKWDISRDRMRNVYMTVVKKRTHGRWTSGREEFTQDF